MTASISQKMFFISTAIIFIFSHSTSCTNIISSSSDSDFSSVSGQWQHCPKGTYATAFRLKYLKWGGLFDMGINSVALYCNTPSGVNSSIKITSYEGRQGSWGDKFLCEGLLIGLAVTINPFSTKNFKGLCVGLDISKTAIEGDGNIGSQIYDNNKKCSKFQAVCGLRTYGISFGFIQGGITKIQMKCCDIPNPASECKATDKWNKVMDCDNILGASQMSCSLEKKVGITTSKSQAETSSKDLKILMSTGFTLERAFPYLTTSLTKSLATESAVHYNWSNVESNTWSTETVQNVGFVIPRGIRQQLHQLVGECGGYIVYSSEFKLVYGDSVANKTTEFNWSKNNGTHLKEFELITEY